MRSVLTVFEFATLNGGERSWLASAPLLQAQGYTLCAAAPASGALAEAMHHLSIPQQAFSFADDRGRRLDQQTLRSRFADLLRQLRPDLVHANSLATTRLVAPVAAACGIPMLGHLRDIIRLSRQAIADVNCAARLIAVSQAVCGHYATAGVATDKVYVLFNGVDLREFSPGGSSRALAAELDLPPASQLVGTIGQIGVRKGQDILLDSAARLVSQFPRAHFVVVGERNSGKREAVEYELRLQERAARSDLRGRVHFLGRRADVSHLLREFTLVAHPARQEPLGRVLLEAAATGVPVVATDVGGTREIFPAHLRAATIVPPADPVAMATALGRLLAHDDERVAMGQRARARAEQRLNIHDSAARLAQHYDDVLISKNP